MGLMASLDFETRSTVELKKSGVHRYAESATTQPWCFYWRIDAGQPQLWTPGSPDPVELLEYINNGGVVVAHNAIFERTIWNSKMPAHWPRLKPANQQCTMARAQALGLPADLDTLGGVLGNAQTKDREGHALMMKMAKPRSIKGSEVVWWDSEENKTRLFAYCKQDVETEREISLKVPPLSAEEQKVWELDQTINDRGVPFDRRMCERAAELTDYSKKMADRELRRLTKGAVGRGSQVGKIMEYLQARGVKCSSFRKGDHETLLFQGELLGDPLVADIIKLRKAASKTSTAKYKAILSCICSDDRVRGLLAYHGARTGRWAGRLVQPQNLHRFDHENDEEVVMLTWLIELLDSNRPVGDVYEMMYFVYGDVLGPLSSAIRSTIRAPEGFKLVGGDYSNIEGRTNAWLAGEDWKVQAFRDYDTIIGVDRKGKAIRKGHDLYKLAYARSFGAEVEAVTKAQRQIGKVQELALGYQGSVGAFITMGANYNVNPFDISKVVKGVVPAEKWDEVAVLYSRAPNKYQLEEAEWTALKIVVNQWRGAHPNIVQSWWAYQDAVIEAVDSLGRIVQVVTKPGVVVPVKYMSNGAFLFCQLPSGRVISYAQPAIEEKVEEVIEGYEVDGSPIVHQRVRRVVTFWGVNSETRTWCKQYLYGGLLCENVTQAVARDIMVGGMFRAERAGYPVILTVHDELVTLVLKPFGSSDELAALMSMQESWSSGLPLAAAAWEDERYVK